MRWGICVVETSLSIFKSNKVKPYINKNTDRKLDVVFSRIELKLNYKTQGFLPQGYCERKTSKS